MEFVEKQFSLKNKYCKYMQEKLDVDQSYFPVISHIPILFQHSMSTPTDKKTQLWRQILSKKWARRRRKEKILITVPNQEQNEPTHIVSLMTN